MTEITELVELAPERVDGVQSPANGVPFLVLKAVSAEEPGAAKAEADEIEEQLTKGAYCGDPVCEHCLKTGKVPVERLRAAQAVKAQLKAADRKAMPNSSFAHVDSDGGKHLPIHDEAHVRAAIGRFGQTKFESDDAKAKAAGKIKTAAGKHGIKVDDTSDVAQAAKGAVQDALQGTRTPVEAGHLDSGKSGNMQPATGKVKELPASTSFQPGGLSSYEIPAEDRKGDENIDSPAPRAGTVWLDKIDNTILTTKSMVAASIFEAMTQVADRRQAAKDGRYLQSPGPANQTPGSAPWESYDAATLDQVATVLAGCCNAIDAIATREQIEALSGDPGDAQHAWDLDCAADALECAMGVVARLAYAEQAEGSAQKEASKDDPHYAAVEKAYRRLRSADEKALRDAHGALSNVLAEHDRKVADAGQDSSEEDQIQMELTKEELAETIAASATQAVKEALDAERKAQKKAEKAEKKAAKLAAKNANNNGDITEAQIRDGVKDKVDANDVGTVGMAKDPKYLNKSEEPGKKNKALKGIEDQLKATTDTLASLGEQVQKMAKRPRQGGPVLDGQARGSFPAAENRMTQGGDKDDAGMLIKSLEESFTKATDPSEKDRLGYELTLARLRKAHETGQI